MRKNKKSHPRNACWDRKNSCGATRLDAFASTFAYVHMPTLDHGASTPSYILKPYRFFRSPSAAHSIRYLPPRSHPPRLSVGTGTGPTSSASSVFCIIAQQTRFVKHFFKKADRKKAENGIDFFMRVCYNSLCADCEDRSLQSAVVRSNPVKDTGSHFGVWRSW